MDMEVLLTQAGYYTIRSVTPDGYAVLGYPNLEVAVSMAQLYADKLLAGKRIRSASTQPIRLSLSAGDVAAVVDYFNSAVTAIDYQRYSITDEASCRAYLQVLLIGAALVPKVEVHNALGRSDLEVDVENQRWVFEFKYARHASDTDILLKEALEQMRSRRCGETHAGTEPIRVALVFDAENRRFSAWSRV